MKYTCKDCVKRCTERSRMYICREFTPYSEAERAGSRVKHDKSKITGAKTDPPKTGVQKARK
jgi:hypothetical protein